MKFRNKIVFGLALGALLASSGAMAALNANEVRLALTSLKLALVKIGVANAVLGDPKPPSSNAEAHLAAPTQLGSEEISAIQIGEGGVINVYLTPKVGITDGIIQLVPQVVTGKDGKKGVVYSCSSPNIADIASAVSDCRYSAAGK